MRKDLKDILAIAEGSEPVEVDAAARLFYESGLEKGYSIGYADGSEEGRRIGREEGMKVWAEAAAAAENEKAAKAKA